MDWHPDDQHSPLTIVYEASLYASFFGASRITCTPFVGEVASEPRSAVHSAVERKLSEKNFCKVLHKTLERIANVEALSLRKLLFIKVSRNHRYIDLLARANKLFSEVWYD